ncbi:uncharacterized protein [Mytilus edulis]|uniref:uncharacterized protein n=1 Tax=Mytilus edulis TaxID=6550 RepID=UPI0039EDF199
MSYDIMRNHWKYQTSWTDGFTCTHVKLQPRAAESPVSPVPYRHPRYTSPNRRSQSSSPEPRNKHQIDSRPVSRKSTKKKQPKTPTQMLDMRREQRACRTKPWTEKAPLKHHNRNKYIETYYENCLPPDADLEELKLHSRKFVANSRYGNIYQIKYDKKPRSPLEKVEEPVTWLWEEDYKVWLRDSQRYGTGRSTPVTPTYTGSTSMTPRGIQVGQYTTRSSDGGYHSIITKPSKPDSTPRMGQSITDKPNAELFAHCNAYRLNKQERRKAAIKIQTRFRGYRIRAHLDKLKRKVVLDHGKSWKNFIKEYKELIVRIQSRYGLMNHSCPIVLKEIDEFMDTKYKYEREFDKTSEKGKLFKEDLSLFLKNCDLHPTDKDISTAFNKIYRGSGNTAEVVLVLDCSTSIGPLGFRRLIQFVKDLVCMYDIAPDRVRIGVLPFNEDIFQSFSISTHRTRHDILNAIDAIRLKHGLTRTHLAIKEMTKMLSNARPGIKKIGIVITDGKSSEPECTELEAKRANDDGIEVYTIGVGESVDKSELLTIASTDKTIYTVKSYNDLADLTHVIAKVTHQEQTRSKMSCWDNGKCRPLTTTESMEILWTLYPPPAANLSHVRKSRWIRPIIQGTEAWSLLDEKTKSSTDIRSCLRIVVQARINKNGSVMLPSKNKTGVEYIKDVDEAVTYIEEWMKWQRENNEESDFSSA